MSCLACALVFGGVTVAVVGCVSSETSEQFRNQSYNYAISVDYSSQELSKDTNMCSWMTNDIDLCHM